MHKILYKDLEIWHVKKRGIKNSYISIDSHAKITLKTAYVSQSYIDELLSKKEPWLRKALKKVAQREVLHLNLEDEILLFGEVFSIDSEMAKPLAQMLCKIEPNTIGVQKAYNKFYLNLAKGYLPQRVDHFSHAMNLSYKGLRFKKLKSRWGSCTSTKEITLNTELMKIEHSLIDYVIVHELAHLVHMNHSKEFHTLVEHYLPNHKSLRKRIKSISLYDE